MIVLYAAHLLDCHTLRSFAGLLRLRPQLLGNLLNVPLDIEIASQKLADIGVLDVSTNLFRAGTSRRVNVDVDGGVSVSAPADVGAERNHGGEDLEGSLGVVSQGLEFVVGGVGDAQAGDDELLVDPLLEVGLGLFPLLLLLAQQQQGWMP